MRITKNLPVTIEVDDTDTGLCKANHDFDGCLFSEFRHYDDMLKVCVSDCHRYNQRLRDRKRCRQCLNEFGKE